MTSFSALAFYVLAHFKETKSAHNTSVLCCHSFHGLASFIFGFSDWSLKEACCTVSDTLIFGSLASSSLFWARCSALLQVSYLSLLFPSGIIWYQISHRHDSPLGANCQSHLAFDLALFQLALDPWLISQFWPICYSWTYQLIMLFSQLCLPLWLKLIPRALFNLSHMGWDFLLPCPQLLRP